MSQDISLVRSSKVNDERESLSSIQSVKSSAVLSLLLVLAHVLLLYGQIATMWAVSIEVQVNVTAGLNSSNPEMESVLEMVNVSKIVEANETVPLESFTYASSVYQLWIEKLPLTYLSAVMLVLFSAIWPHLKLVLLHFYYYSKQRMEPRRHALYYLSAFGKLSLADVCVVCFIFAVINNTLYINAGALWTSAEPAVRVVADEFVKNALISPQAQEIVDYGIENISLPLLAQVVYEQGDDKLYNKIVADACSKVAGEQCPVVDYQPVKASTFSGMFTRCVPIYLRNNCNGCECFISTTVANYIPIPEPLLNKTSSYILAVLLTISPTIVNDGLSLVQVSGSISVGLDVVIFAATITFTLGVYTSISCSVWVDSIEERFTRNKFGFSSLKEAIANRGPDLYSRKLFFTQGERHLPSILLLSLVGIAVLPVMACGMFLDIFDWKIGGLFPELYRFNDVLNGTFADGDGVAASFQLSLVKLVSMIANGGATALLKFFMVLFGISAVGFPLLRCALFLVLACVPLRVTEQIAVAHVANVIGAFGAIEPLICCVILIMFELPPLTDQVITTPECDVISASFPFNYLINRYSLYDTYCFVMWFQLLPMSAVLVLGWFMSVWINAEAWSKTLTLYRPTGCPSDPGGPYCCCSKRSPCCASCDSSCSDCSGACGGQGVSE